MKKSLNEMQRAIQDTAHQLTVQLEALNEANPVAAGNVYKSVIQYLQEKNTTRTMFTVKELEDFGYLPRL